MFYHVKIACYHESCLFMRVKGKDSMSQGVDYLVKCVGLCYLPLGSHDSKVKGLTGGGHEVVTRGKATRREWGVMRGDLRFGSCVLREEMTYQRDIEGTKLTSYVFAMHRLYPTTSPSFINATNNTKKSLAHSKM